MLLLDVPVVLQSSVTSCALATVSGIVWYLTGRQVPQRKLSAMLGQRWAKDGTRMADAVNLVRRFAGVEVEERSCTTFALVEAAIRSRRPMLAALHVDPRLGHMTTVVGVVTGRNAQVVVNDPNFRWSLLIPWAEFSASLQCIAFVSGVPASTVSRSAPAGMGQP
jgi:hypothetical protein